MYSAVENVRQLLATVRHMIIDNNDWTIRGVQRIRPSTIADITRRSGNKLIVVSLNKTLISNKKKELGVNIDTDN
jgi:hypothetical protein